VSMGPEPAFDPGQTLVPGTRVGDRYTIVAPISAGAMGAVYRAQDDDGTEVALKRLLDPAHAARFEIEARLLERLKHPRVVHVRGPVLDGEEKFLAMDLVQGHDLAHVIEERGEPGLPVDEVITWACQACSALEYVHSQQIVHRDVKPANLILGEDGVVVVDFGVARLVEDENDPGTRAIGTPRYMAPEVFVGEGVSPRSDVYAMAATVWAMLTGKPPVYADKTKLTEVCEGLTADAEATLRQALEIRPERRVSSAAALAAALGAPVGTAAKGESFAVSEDPTARGGKLLEEIVRTAAGVFEAAAASVAIADPRTGELVYRAAWGAGAEEVVGMRLPEGVGLAGAVAASGLGEAVPACRDDQRFARRLAEGSGYVPYTMLLTPLKAAGEVLGVLSLLDRRDGRPYGPEDLVRADLFADLTVAALPHAS
jgi:predicted Ser/Thr protein kinase